MRDTPFDIPMSSVGKRLTLTVRVRMTGIRAWRVRWWFARQLIVLAARVAGCAVQIDLDGPRP